MTQPPALADFLQRLGARRARVAVIGLGYVGLAIGLQARRVGLAVSGLDRDAARARAASAAGVPSGTDRAVLEGSDAFLVCVPSGAGADGRPDLSAVIDAARALGPALRPGALVVLESTVFPGATRAVLLPELLAAARAAGRELRPGADLFVAHAPERVDPGRSDPPPERIPRLVGGLDEPSLDAAAALYGLLFERVVRCSSAEVAEAAKVLENIFRSVNIALANEIEMILTPLSVPVQEVLDAAATKPFGFLAFRPGAGVGGHCVPAAPSFLLEAARRAGAPAPLTQAAAEVNRHKPAWLVQRARLAVAARRAAAGRPAPPGSDPLRGARVLVVGVAYKPGVAETHGSPGLVLLQLLAAAGAQVAYHDPLVPRVPDSRPEGVPELESVPIETAAEYDAVVRAWG